MKHHNSEMKQSEPSPLTSATDPYTIYELAISHLSIVYKTDNSHSISKKPYQNYTSIYR